MMISTVEWAFRIATAWEALARSAPPRFHAAPNVVVLSGDSLAFGTDSQRLPNAFAEASVAPAD